MGFTMQCKQIEFPGSDRKADWSMDDAVWLFVIDLFIRVKARVR
jgi:hypothetical protein